MRPKLFAPVIFVGLLFALVSTPVIAGVEGVSLNVVAPETADVGSLVVLDASDSTVKTLRWVGVSVAGRWESADNGSRVFFSMPKSEAVFVLVGITPTEGGAEALILTREVRIKPTNVPPEPGPDPPTPANLSQRVTAAFDAGPDLVKDAATLHGVFSALRDALADPNGPIKSESDLITTAEKSLQLAGWKPNKYPRLSLLMGEVLGRDVPASVMSAARRVELVDQFSSIADGAKKAGQK